MGCPGMPRFYYLRVQVILRRDVVIQNLWQL